jgi:hypothetical protein
VLLRKIATSFLLAATTLLTACDPGVSFAWDKRFQATIDPNCIEAALKTIDARVGRSSFVSDGSEGIPSGANGTQFEYAVPEFQGIHAVRIVKLSTGETLYRNAWVKLGTSIEPAEAAMAEPVLRRVNDAVGRSCGLSFAGSRPREVR